MNTFEKISTDDEIIDIYYQVSKNEENSEVWAHHNFDHVSNVTKLVETILTKLNCDKTIIEQAKIAAILHDVGMVEGKKDHEIRAYDFAKDYLKRKNIKLENEDLVLDAIKSHRNGFDTNNIIALALILADKLDVKYTRIAKDGYKIVGMRQIQFIKDVRIDIEDNVFIVKFVCDKKLDKKELEEYYFVEKMANAVKAFCKKMDLEYKVLYNEELWKKFL